MYRQSGFTLVEILAAITILGIILAVGTGVYFSLFKTRDSSIDRRVDQHNMNLVLSTLSMNINESVEAAYRETGGRKELRLMTGAVGGYIFQVFSYDITNNTLYLYKLNDVDKNNFHNSGSLVNEFMISGSITGFQVSFPTKSLTDVLSEGDPIEIAIEFEKSDGQLENVTRKYKLLKDN